MNVQSIDHAQVKHAFVTHAVPFSEMAGVRELENAPQPGDIILAEVLGPLGHHTRLEQRSGATWHIFPGDWLMGAFGNRYATDQYEAYVPKEPVAECHLLSVGGVCGQVVSKHPSMDTPTRLRILGGVCDAQGWSLNTRSFGLPAREAPAGAEIILVVGSAMNSGKTTTVGTLTRALRKGGFRVAAAKVTGTAAGKDGRYFQSCGARPVLDFTHAGYPSTYMATLEELLGIQEMLFGHLREAKPDYIIIEVADGIFQRETRMLLEHEEFRRRLHHVFFAASDSLSAECGARCLKIYDLPLRALVGSFTQSALAMREAETATGMRVLNVEQMLTGGVLEAMGLPLPPAMLPMPAELQARLVDPALLPFQHNGRNGEAKPLLAEVPAPASNLTFGGLREHAALKPEHAANGGNGENGDSNHLSTAQ